MQKRTSLDQLTSGNTDGKSDKSIRSMSIYGVNYCAMTMKGNITILRNVHQVFRRTEP